jgi:zinc protease
MVTISSSPGFSGLAPVRTVLPNGAVVLAKRTGTMPAVTINLAMRAGSVCDPADAPGAMYLLSRVLDRGTLETASSAPRSAEDIAEALDSRGISIGLSVTRHLFSLVCTCLAEDFEAVMALVGDIVRAPAVPQDELATRKGEVVTAIRQDQDNPGVRAVEALMGLLYPPPHPYGIPAKGNPEVIERLTRDHLMALHAARFAPSELSVVVVGDVDASRGLRRRSVYGDWSAPAPRPVDISGGAAPPAARRHSHDEQGAGRLAFRFTTITRRSSYYAYRIMPSGSIR